MKKTIASGLVLSMIPGLCLGVNDRIYKLMQEKQQKMEQLEKCQGTTKNLKIAGISTLGITAIGVGANIAEAVVLDKAKTATKKAETDYNTQVQIKEAYEASLRSKQAAAAANSASSGSIKIVMNTIVDSKARAISMARDYSGAETDNKPLNLAEQYCSDSYPATLSCSAGDKRYVFLFNMSKENVSSFDRVQATYREAIDEYIAKDSTYAGKIDTKNCRSADQNTITCRLNNFYEYNFTFGKIIKANPNNLQTISTFKDVQLNNIYQARRMIEVAHDTGTGLKLETCDTSRLRVWVAADRASQDFVECQGYYNTQEFEFDDLSDRDDKKDGTVYQSLQQYFCGKTGKDLKDSCMDDVLYVWNGTKKGSGTTMSEEEEKRINDEADKADARMDEMIQKYFQGCIGGCKMRQETITVDGVSDTYTIVLCGTEETYYNPAGNAVKSNAVKSTEATPVATPAKESGFRSAEEIIAEENEKAESTKSLEDSKKEYYDNLRQQAKTAFDARTMEPKRAIEEVTKWGQQNGITLKDCNEYTSDNTVVCDDDFEFQFAEIINVRERARQEAKNHFADEGAAQYPTQAIESVMEFSDENGLNLKNCKATKGSNTVTCDNGFEFNFAEIIWSRDYQVDLDYEIKTYDEAIAAIQNQYPREVEEDGFRCNPPTDNKIYCFTKNGEYEITRRFIFEYDVPKK